MRCAVLALGLGLALGCSRQAQRGDGSEKGCETWTVPEEGTCRARPWVLPDATDGIGEPGARLRSMAIDGAGMGIAAWEVALSGRGVVEVGEELSPGVWTVRAPRAPAEGLEPGSAPVVAGGVDGSAIVTWVHAARGGEVLASERDAWGRWRPGEVLSRPPGAVEPWVAAGPAGEQIAVWCQQAHGRWGVAVARRPAPGTPWERPSAAEEVVSPDILFANHPQVALGANGEAIVAWYQSEGVPLMTYVSERRRSGETFSRPRAPEYLSANGAPVDSDPVANPKPALGPHGEAAVVWTQENGAGAVPVYLATRDASGTWTKPRGLDDAFSPPSGKARDVRAAFGPGGELYVVWAQDGAILGARRDATGRWENGGRDPLRLSSPGRTAWGPTLAAGPEGAAVAAWVERWGPHDERVAARRTGGDRRGWEAIELLSGPRTAPVSPPVAAMGRGDRALVGWSAGPPGDARVVVARVD